MIEVNLIDKNEPYYIFDIKGIRHKFLYLSSANCEDLFIEINSRFLEVRYFLNCLGIAEKNQSWEILLWRKDMKIDLKMLYVEMVG